MTSEVLYPDYFSRHKGCISDTDLFWTCHNKQVTVLATQASSQIQTLWHWALLCHTSCIWNTV